MVGKAEKGGLFQTQDNVFGEFGINMIICQANNHIDLRDETRSNKKKSSSLWSQKILFPD